jgi:hypothetical protein
MSFQIAARVEAPTGSFPSPPMLNRGVVPTLPRIDRCCSGLLRYVEPNRYGCLQGFKAGQGQYRANFAPQRNIMALDHSVVVCNPGWNTKAALTLVPRLCLGI